MLNIIRPMHIPRYITNITGTKTEDTLVILLIPPNIMRPTTTAITTDVTTV